MRLLNDVPLLDALELILEDITSHGETKIYVNHRHLSSLTDDFNDQCM